MKPSEYWDDGRTEREFEESGLQCCTRAMEIGHRCGYVAVPKGHPMFGKTYDEVYDIDPDLRVDGGVTFAQGTGDIWILGWDAGHSWHRRDESIMSDAYREAWGRVGDLLDDLAYYMVDADRAEAETRRFARQLAEAGKPAFLCDTCACKGTMEDGMLITCSWHEVTHKKRKGECDRWEPEAVMRDVS